MSAQQPLPEESRFPIKRLLRSIFSSTRKILLVYFIQGFLFCTFLLAITFDIPEFYHSGRVDNCKAGRWTYLMPITSAFFAILYVAVAVLFFVKKVKENLMINVEYALIGIVGVLIAVVFPLTYALDSKDSAMIISYLTVGVEFFIFVVLTVFPLYKYHRVVADSKDSLEDTKAAEIGYGAFFKVDLLKNDSFIKEFNKFCMLEFSAENLRVCCIP
jgi:hypothetical protein